ncbi:MAG: ABC transporter substrate-binding protein [Alphaproteobacteria bacterium]|nr:ABC transporter substrate-binding protein [Alphaproteobacteria bacterium]
MFSFLAAAVVVAGLAAPAPAQDLRVGVEAGPTSNDPHYHSLITNIAFSRHIFEPLVVQDAQQNLVPGLATSWKAIEPTVWEIKLRPGVTWHDGAPFTADDVKFTLGRAGNVPNSPSSFSVYTRPVREVEVVDPLTVRLHTHAPTPLMPNYLSLVMTVSRRHGEGATTADYNSGKAMIGTGPFRYAGWEPNQSLVVQRNDAYWGPKPAFARVNYKAIPVAATRVAALRAGDVDLIEIVPPDEMTKLKQETARFATAESISNRLIFLLVDADREASPHVQAKAGGAIANPLRDPRVRKALSKAINRDALVDRIMDKAALAAGDLGPPGYFGTSPDLKPEAFDPEGARRLLAEAGLPDGFTLTLHGPSDRYVNDEKVIQAIAQMWSRIGLAAKVEAVPRANYFSRASRLEFSAMLLGFSPNPEVIGMLETLVHTFDAQLGLGTNNRGRYSNKATDAMIREARSTVDDDRRRALTQAATRAALADTAVIPLYFQYNTWAMRKGLAYEPRTDEMTLATSARPAN